MIKMVTEIQAQLNQKRREKGMTQEALAQRLGVTASRVSKWERGDNQLPLEMVSAYAKALGLTIHINVEGDIQMIMETKQLQPTSEYETFQVEQVKEAIQQSEAYRKQQLEALENRLEIAKLQLCNEAGHIIVLSQLNETRADDYRWGESFYLRSRSSEELADLEIFCEGEFEARSFRLPDYLKKVEDLFSYDVMKEIEKAMYFACTFESRGTEVLYWATKPMGERKRVEAKGLFPYLSEEGFEALMSVMNIGEWVQTEGDRPSLDFFELTCLNLVEVDNEKEWGLAWMDQDERIELGEVIVQLTDALEVALMEWQHRFC